MGTVNTELLSGDLDSEIMKIYFGQCIIVLAVMLLTLDSLVTHRTCTSRHSGSAGDTSPWAPSRSSPPAPRIFRYIYRYLDIFIDI